MNTRERFKGVIGWFSENVPEAETELHYRTPYELLVAVMLSAQCTDKRINMVTPALFERFPTSKELSRTDSDDVFEYIRSVSYPRAKAEYLVTTAQRIEEVYSGRVPDTMADLLTLKGVGRKTANVILSIVYDQPAMAVDTHVFRVAERIGLTTNSLNPTATERLLVAGIPSELLGLAHHWLILHGRYICTARSPKCDSCGISQWCRWRARELKKAQALSVLL